MGPSAQSAFVYGFLAIAAGTALLFSPSILQGLRNIVSSKPPVNARQLWASWSRNTGVAALFAAPWAIQIAGPGAILWATVGSLLGMGFAVLAPHIPHRRLQSLDDQLRDRLPSAVAYPRGRSGQILRPAYCLFGLAGLVILGALVVGNEGHAVVSMFLPDLRIEESWRATPVMLLTALFCLLRPQKRARWSQKTAGWAMVAWVFMAVFALAVLGELSIDAFWRILDDGSSFPAGQSGLAKFLLLASTGFAAALWATGVGLGWEEIKMDFRDKSAKPSVDLPTEIDLNNGASQSDRERAAARDRLHAPVQLITLWIQGVLISWLTACFLLASQTPAQQRIDHPDMRSELSSGHPELVLIGQETRSEEDSGVSPDQTAPPRALAKWLPLERRHLRSFAPTDSGQSVVLPLDSPIKPGREYRALFRANPRGYRIGQLTPTGNGLFVASPWLPLHKVDTLRFRPRNKELAKSPAWDQPIKVRVIRLGSDQFPAGVIYVPQDPQVDLSKLSRTLDGPFVVLPDVELMVEARLFERSQEDGGGNQHYSLIARKNHPTNRVQPPLRALIAELGYRGPYLYGDAGKHAPEVLIANPDIDTPIGSQLHLRYATPERGLAVGAVQVDGSLVTPPWDFLQHASALYFRHTEAPHLDIRVPTRGRFVDGRLEFRSEDPNFSDLRQLMRHPDYRGPYLLAPDYEFEVEVHRGDELPDPPGTKTDEKGLARGPWADFKTLVPLHPDAEAVGGRAEIHRPHPSELVVTNAKGPYLDSSPARWLCAALGYVHPVLGILGRIVLAVLLLCSLGIAMNRAMVLVEGFLGRGAWVSIPLVWISAVFWGTQVSWAYISPAILGSVALIFGVYGVACAWTALVSVVASRRG